MQHKAITTYAHINGRLWKSALRRDWERSHYPYFDRELAPYLQQLRNERGYRWLDKFKVDREALTGFGRVRPVRLNRDQKRFVALGIELFGRDGWQSKFARATGLSQQLVNNIANGERAATESVKSRVIVGLHQEIERLQVRRAAVISALQDYQHDYEQE